jgi:hypothetical protein
LVQRHAPGTEDSCQSEDEQHGEDESVDAKPTPVEKNVSRSADHEGAHKDCDSAPAFRSHRGRLSAIDMRELLVG